MTHPISFRFLQPTLLVAHEIAALKSDDQQRPRPIYGTSPLHLDTPAQVAFTEKIRDALGKRSKCMQMEIDDAGEASFCACAEELLSCGGDTEAFVKKSKKLADLLHNASDRHTIPGGLLLVFTGTVGARGGVPFVAALKAEAHPGFIREQTERGPTLSLLKELFLTGTARFYKLGIFVRPRLEEGEDPDEVPPFIPFVYDTTMSRAERASARYFYETFLGCRFPDDAAHRTKLFFDLTRSFIFGDGAFNSADRYEYFLALLAYLNSNRESININDFAELALHDDTIQDAYLAWMEEKRFPDIDVAKDVGDIKEKLKRRRLRFAGGISLTGPADEVAAHVSIESIQGPEDARGRAQQWTQITIRKPFDGAE